MDTKNLKFASIFNMLSLMGLVTADPKVRTGINDFPYLAIRKNFFLNCPYGQHHNRTFAYAGYYCDLGHGRSMVAISPGR